MTNIWADTYKQIRDPFFQIEDPYTVSEEKKEKKEKEEPGEKKNEKKDEKEDEKEDGKPKRWWDDDGDGKGYEKGEVSGKFPKKKVNKEERELYSKKDKIEKLDVRTDIKNKVQINPKITEELEAWIDELLSEGYDLSSFTLEEVAEIYESVEVHQLDEVLDTPERANEYARKNVRSMLGAFVKGVANKDISQLKTIKKRKRGAELAKRKAEKKAAEEMKEQTDIYDIIPSHLLDEVDTYGMPARGDAQAQKVDPMAAAKAKAARAKVSKEIADLQVAKQAQRTKVSTTESVITYLAGRTPFYEGMYDPKKTKMRPASERSKTEMTDAQRKKAREEQERVTQIHDRGERVLTGMIAKSRSSSPMGTERKEKPEAPEANRKLGKGKQDTLASKADKVLKSLKK